MTRISISRAEFEKVEKASRKQQGKRTTARHIFRIVDKREGRRNGEPWSVTLEQITPTKGVAFPWRIIVQRGWPDTPHRESPLVRAAPRKPLSYAKYANEPLARAAFAAAVRTERSK